MLHVLAYSKTYEARVQVALNRNTPKAALLKLVDDPVPSIGKAILERRSRTSQEVYQKYAERSVLEGKYNVISHIAQNTQAGAKVLTYIAKNFLKEEYFATGSSYVVVDILFSVASNKKCPASVLRDLHATGDPGILQNIAGNTSAPADLLKQIHESHPQHKGIRKALSMNHSAPAEILLDIIREPNVEAAVIYNIAINASSDSLVIEELFNKVQSMSHKELTHVFNKETIISKLRYRANTPKWINDFIVMTAK